MIDIDNVESMDFMTTNCTDAVGVFQTQDTSELLCV